MPAAAVIPAPIAYIKVVAVKKLVVGFLFWMSGPLPLGVRTYGCSRHFLRGCLSAIKLVGWWACIVYCEKIRVFKAGVCSFEYISME